MPDLFGLDLAGIVEAALDSAGGLLPATLIKVRPGARTPGDLASGTNADATSYPTQGIAQPGSDRDFAGSSWQATRLQRCTITLLGAPLTRAGVEPEVGDRVAIVDINGATVTYTIDGPVARDPAAATYTLTAAGA